MTLAALSQTYPSIPWKEYFEKLLPSSTTLEEDEVIFVCAPDYFSRLERLLAVTPKRVQANYLMWRAIFLSIPYLTGRRTSDECRESVSEKFPIVLGAMYVKQFFSSEIRENAIEMVTDIRRQFNIILENIDWMDEKTRTSALNKAIAMVHHVGYPDELLDDEKVEKIYEKFKVPGRDHFKNVLYVNNFNANLYLGNVHEPVNKSKWMSHADSASVDAYYSILENSLRFPAGILHSTFFNKERPKYMNYGAIGYAIGHEITHGFDNFGRKFDERGHFFNWWEPSTEERYRKRAECFIEQFGNYTVQDMGLNLNGIKTQGENIADSGGLKIAYLAYKSWVARNKPEKKLPGIDRTPEQMFWLSAANFWCTKYTPEGLRSEITSEPHSPEEFRIIGSLSNMPEFANDYKCPKGSRMNRKNKCSIW